jgi:hypothetical protein
MPAQYNVLLSARLLRFLLPVGVLPHARGNVLRRSHSLLPAGHAGVQHGAGHVQQGRRRCRGLVRCFNGACSNAGQNTAAENPKDGHACLAALTTCLESSSERRKRAKSRVDRGVLMPPVRRLYFNLRYMLSNYVRFTLALGQRAGCQRLPSSAELSFQQTHPCPATRSVP